MSGDCNSGSTCIDVLRVGGRGTVCGSVPCCRTPNTLCIWVRRVVGAFRVDLWVKDLEDGQTGMDWVLRPFSHMRLPASGRDTPSPYGLECRRWFARRQIELLPTSFPDFVCRPTVCESWSADPTSHVGEIPPRRCAGPQAFVIPRRWHTRVGPQMRTVRSACW